MMNVSQSFRWKVWAGILLLLVVGLVSGGKAIKTWKGSRTLQGILPGSPMRSWSEALPLAGVPAGKYKFCMRVPNPLPLGRPVRFANETQDADLPGWLTLGEVRVP